MRLHLAPEFLVNFGPGLVFKVQNAAEGVPALAGEAVVKLNSPADEIFDSVGGLFNKVTHRLYAAESGTGDECVLHMAGKGIGFVSYGGNPALSHGTVGGGNFIFGQNEHTFMICYFQSMS